MDRKTIIEKIKKAAEKDARKRKDLRYKRAMAFLTKKGLLKANMDFEKYYVAKLQIADLIWAGKNVEPRILEVLPAAAVRLPKAFKFRTADQDENELRVVMNELAHGAEVGHDFLKTPYAKIKVWMNLRLTDQRTKPQQEKKITKTFRLTPTVVKKLEMLRLKFGFVSETAVLEKLVLAGLK